MKKVTTYIFLVFALLLVPAVEAGTRMEALVLDAHDGQRINGFLYQNEKTPKDAPIALLLHGLTGNSMHWIADGFPTYGGKLSDMLIEKGYRIVAIDARAHGIRKNKLSPIDRVMSARKGEPAAYRAMIENTIADYNSVIAKLQKNFPDTKRIVAVGYSMGAQMAVLLAAQNDAVTHIVTMVPPYVGNVPVVAPITYADDVKVPWLLLTANKDQFSTPEQNAKLAAAASVTVDHKTFHSGHVLPAEYLAEVEAWTAALQE